MSEPNLKSYCDDIETANRVGIVAGMVMSLWHAAVWICRELGN